MGSFWYECVATAERCSCIYSGQPRRAVVVGPCPDVRPSRDQKPADLHAPRRKGKFPLQVSGRVSSLWRRLVLR